MIKPQSLPVYQEKEKILDSLKNNQVIIVESPTGSGKTTQIPIILNEAGYANNGIIGITQPRRIATLSVSEYIEKQLGDTYPQSYCAYKMRFYDTTTHNTKIKILTDGMLLQEIKADTTLSDYSVIMIDEAHERSLNIDFILGLVSEIIKKRSDLKVIISSATINTGIFSKYFNNAPVISINAKNFNVDIKYYPIETKHGIDELPITICQIVNKLLKDFKKSNYTDNKDTLVFLSGELDIKNTMRQLYENCDYKHLQIYPLYGRMNKEEQEQVFEETQTGKMKLVLATNIAETSLTIDGIKVVIDSGLSKINYYNQLDFTSSLVTRKISKASAKQRAGRAGRTSDGICYRLYSEEDFKNRPQYTQEEILRTDLSEVVLRMCDLGIYDIEKFPFITKPGHDSILSGEKTLKLLGAIDNQRHLTNVGEMLVKYPLLPRLARCIYEAIKIYPEVIKPVVICVSFLSCKTPFILPANEEDMARNAHKRFSNQYGDFIGYQYLFEKYTNLTTNKAKEKFCEDNYLDFQSMQEIVHVTQQLCDITRELGIPVNERGPENTENFVHKCLHCLAKGLIQYICVKKRTLSYKTLNADDIYIHPGSAWFRTAPQFIIAGEIVYTSKLYARTVSPMKKEWINDVSPELLSRITSNAKVDKQKSTIDKQIIENKKYNIYGKDYPVVFTSGKNSKPIVVIPFEDSKYLFKKYTKASRHPKSFNATILFKGYFLFFGERLYEVLHAGSRIDFDKAQLISDIPSQIYTIEDLKQIKKHLEILMCFSKLAKYQNRLGFVELICSKNGFFYHVNASFNEAINNTAYSLLTIMDSYNDKQINDEYNRIIRYLD